MRFSTNYIFQHQIDGMTKAMNNYNGIASRLSAGQTLLTPSDDPSAASQAVVYQDDLSRVGQFDTARTYAQNALGLEDNALDSISNLLSGDLAAKIVAAGDASYSDSDRQDLATELKGVRDNLLNLGNTKDNDGRYIFAGYKTGAAAFQDDGTYVGGDTAMTQVVADDTEMQVGDTGSDIFLSGTSDDLFNALDKAIRVLNKPADTDDERKHLQATLDSVNKSLHKGIDNLGKVRARVGVNMQQLESLGFSSDAKTVSIEDNLQKSLGADPDSSITLISQSKMSEFALSASMEVFQNMSKLSIFNM